MFDNAIFVKSLSSGCSLYKYPSFEPVFEIWEGFGDGKTFVYRFNSIDEVIKYLDKDGYCVDRAEAIKLLNSDCEPTNFINQLISEVQNGHI